MEKLNIRLLNIKSLLLTLLLIATAFTVISYLIIEPYSAQIHSVKDDNLTSISKDIAVGIVFGGGISNSKPSPLIQDRLDVGKNLLDNGIVDKLLLSGDNRFENYNEPVAMYNYLLDQGVNPNKLQADFAGRSTYETCERARKIFGVEEAILVSESTHLPRALYLCKHFGVEGFGVKSDGDTAGHVRLPQQFREVIARAKAVFNIYIYGEKTVLGDPISF